MADVEIGERSGLSPFARSALMRISGEIDGSVHGRFSLTVSRSEAGRGCFTLLHPEPRASARASWVHLAASAPPPSGDPATRFLDANRVHFARKRYKAV
jgi:hypothetical protein